MILKIEEARSFLGYEEDYTGADVDILPMALSAEAYLKNGGCILNPDDELAKLAVKMLLNHWYSNREPIGKTDLIAFGLQNIMLQLKYSVTPVTDATTTTAESGGTV